MKRLMVITADYYPAPTSTTNCIEPLINGLENRGWKIDIITRKQKKNVPERENESPMRTIWRVEDYRFINTNYWNEKIQLSKTRHMKVINTMLSIFFKSLVYLRFCLFRLEPSFSGWDVKKTVNLCKKLITEENYNGILSISHPVITHYIAMEVKKSISCNISWYLYEFDPFCYNRQIYRFKRFQTLFRLQNQFFEECDLIFVIPSLYKYYLKTEFKKYTFKMIDMEYANLHKVNIDISNAVVLLNNPAEYNFFYAGALPRYVRNPRYLLEIFSQLDPLKYHLTIVSGTKLKYAKKEFASASKTVTLYSRQSRDTSYLNMVKSDILVNIGNAVSFQTPGKIFEYIAIGKPIIHFSKIIDDPCLQYLKSYPYALILKEYEGTVIEHINAIAKFCEDFGHKTLQYSQVLEYTKEFCSETVISKFCTILGG